MKEIGSLQEDTQLCECFFFLLVFFFFGCCGKTSESEERLA